MGESIIIAPMKRWLQQVKPHLPIRITKVSADATPEGQNVEARQRKQPVARSTSTEVTQDSTREALDDGAGAETDDALDFLTGDLKSIFKTKVSANPHTRRLIEKHGTVDAHDLVNDLRGLLRSIEEVE